jgi:replicative DNA helicase
MNEQITGTKIKRPITPHSASLSMDMGKLPPQALDLEEAVLGALLLEKEAVNDVIDILQPESFYKDSHQKIFSAVKELFGEGSPIDLLTVTDKLRKQGHLEYVGGPYYISQLTNRVASAANIEFHARIIAQKHILRELIRISSNTITKAFDDSTDVFDLLDESEANLFQVAENNIRKTGDRMGELVRQAISRIEELGKRDEGISGVPTGFRDLDEMTSGLQPSDMIILAARPAMGKTSFALTLARNTASYGKGVAVFSLEMSSVQLVTRLISSETGLTSDKLRKGKLAQHEWQQLTAKVEDLTKAPIFIDDTPAISIFELRAKCRRLKSKENIQLIVIDYLQLMTAGGKGGNREQEISTISRSLKGLAKELDVPIIALSQLSRQVETRTGHKRPMLSDLRESGAIEQDADIVMFLYRPSYYGFTEDEEGNSVEGITELIIAKHRNGKVDTVKLKFIDHLAKFVNSDYNEMSFGSELPQSSEFGGGYTISSRMNDDDLPPFDDDIAPF